MRTGYFSNCFCLWLGMVRNWQLFVEYLGVLFIYLFIFIFYYYEVCGESMDPILRINQ